MGSSRRHHAAENKPSALLWDSGVYWEGAPPPAAPFPHLLFPCASCPLCFSLRRSLFCFPGALIAPQSTVDAICPRKGPDAAATAQAPARPASSKSAHPVRLQGLRLTAVGTVLGQTHWGRFAAGAAAQIRGDWVRAVCHRAGRAAEAPRGDGSSGGGSEDVDCCAAEEGVIPSESALQVVDRCKQQGVPVTLLATAQPLALTLSPGVRSIPPATSQSLSQSFPPLGRACFVP